MSNLNSKGYSPLAVLAENVSVEYRTYLELAETLRRFYRSGKALSPHVKALDNVSLDVKKGEIVGVIGNNGAGKSTLLKAVSRVIVPTSGVVKIWGRPAAMLGLGVGFHREFSGRENLFLYSALLGRSEKRTREQYDHILEFAELREVIDDPLRTYSVGMTARLGFAVALAEQPEILLVDEVLGVGDIQFREKCLERFREICAQGSTIIMASHNMIEIKENCQRVLWLDHGRVRMFADADAVVQNYIRERGPSPPPKK